MSSPYSFPQPTEVVKETHLSRKPAQASPWVAAWSVAALFVTSGVYWTDAFGLGSQLAATPETVFDRGEYWRLLTSIGTHADLEHLLGNSLVLGILAFLLYGYFGATIYPMVTLVCGVVVTGLSLATYPPLTILVGASGVVYLMAGFWLTLYLFVERRFTVTKRLLRAAGFGFIVLMPTVVEPTVSYRTHALGFVIGTALGVAYFSANKRRLRAAERVEIDLDE